MPSAGKVVYLVRPAGYEQQTKARLLELLADDEVIGLAYAVMRRGGRYGLDFVGSAKAHPLITRALICMLEDQVRDAILSALAPYD